jgi:hypothetical protein
LEIPVGRPLEIPTGDTFGETFGDTYWRYPLERPLEIPTGDTFGDTHWRYLWPNLMGKGGGEASGQGTREPGWIEI